jgi:nucleotide-binding universal stress UspA family protein
MIRRILCATDFSPASHAALDTAAELARRFSARLTLFHAHQVPTFVYPDGMMPLAPELMMDLERSVVAELDRLASSLRDLEVEVRHTLGAPAAEICRAADEIDADLIVLGTHGRTGLSHVVLGSVAEKVVRKCTRPVLTIHPDDHPLEATT